MDERDVAWDSWLIDRSGCGEGCSSAGLSGCGEGAWENVAAETLLEDETLGAIGGETTSGSRVMDIVGDGTCRMEVTRGEGASRADSTTGDEASRAETVNALWDEDGREMGDAADCLLVRTGFFRRP